jgi:hypothetical protein
MTGRIFAVKREIAVEADGSYARLNRGVLLVNANAIHLNGSIFQVYTLSTGIHAFTRRFVAQKPLIVMKAKLRIASCPPMWGFVAHHECLHPINLLRQRDTRDMDAHLSRSLAPNRGVITWSGIASGRSLVADSLRARHVLCSGRGSGSG